MSFQSCAKKEGIEDPRKQQLRYIKQIEQLRAEVQGSFLEGYYDEIIRRLELGEIVKSPDMEDVDFFPMFECSCEFEKISVDARIQCCCA